MPRIVFLTRGDAQQGMGHLHRVSWLAQSVTDQQRAGLTVSIHCLDSSEAREFWRQRAADVLFVADLNAAATQLASGDTVVIDWLDSPVVTVEQVNRIIGRGDGAGKLVLLDEYGPAQYRADLVINALLAPLETTETVERGTRIVAGAAYVQLPLSALRLRGVSQAKAQEAATLLSGPPPKLGPVRAVLVSFGGVPQAELVRLALDALRAARFEGKVIVMPGKRELVKSRSPFSLDLPASPPAGDMDVEYIPAGDEFHDYMAGADLAILAGGLSLYEAAFFGVPAVCVPLVEHQQNTALKLERAGCCRLTGMPGKVNSVQLAAKLKGLLGSARLRGRMSFHGMRLIDGRGLQRTVEAILDLLWFARR